MKPILSFVFVLLTVSFHAHSQKTKTFKWADDCCEYEGTYDPALVTENQLKNTFNLFFWGYTIQANQSVFKLKDLPELNYDSLVNEYARKTLQVSSLDIIDKEYWKDYRKNVITELNQVFYAKKITLKAHEDPSILLTYSGGDSCVNKYAKAIAAGGDLMLEAWREQLEYQCSKNGYPEKLRQKFNEMYNSPDQLKHALVELLNFGWWNCINHTIDYTSEIREDAYDKFREQFTHIKKLDCGCD